jgi:hypothetical protein
MAKNGSIDKSTLISILTVVIAAFALIVSIGSAYYSFESARYTQQQAVQQAPHILIDTYSCASRPNFGPYAQNGIYYDSIQFENRGLSPGNASVSIGGVNISGIYINLKKNSAAATIIPYEEYTVFNFNFTAPAHNSFSYVIIANYTPSPKSSCFDITCTYSDNSTVGPNWTSC